MRHPLITISSNTNVKWIEFSNRFELIQKHTSIFNVLYLMYPVSPLDSTLTTVKNPCQYRECYLVSWNSKSD